MSSGSQQAGGPDPARELVAGRYHRLQVVDCPIAVLEHLAREVGYGATVENVRPVPAWNEWFESRQAVFPGASEGALRRWACFALAGPTTDGTSVIVTPDSQLMDLVEESLSSGMRHS